LCVVASVVSLASMKYMTSLTILMGMLLALPSERANAYFTTAQTAISATEQTALYTITYRFGLKNDDLYMPIIATRGLSHGSNQYALGYEILEESKAPTTTGISAGIVLSNAKIENGMYKVPKGRSASFTLFVIYSVEKLEEETDYALHVQELPFYVGDNKDARKLNPSELQYYVSPEAELNPND